MVWLNYDAKRLRARADAIFDAGVAAQEEGWQEEVKARDLLRSLEAPLR